MQTGKIRTLIENKSDTEIVICVIYDKDEANEHLANNLLWGEQDIESKYLSPVEWLHIVQKVNNDEGMWQEINNTFVYHLEKEVANRKKGEVNDNSK